MTVDLGPKLEAFISALVRNGRYRSKSEVLREGIRLVQDREGRLAAFTASLDRALADVDAGRTQPIDEVLGELEARYRETADAAE